MSTAENNILVQRRGEEYEREQVNKLRTTLPTEFYTRMTEAGGIASKRLRVQADFTDDETLKAGLLERARQAEEHERQAAESAAQQAASEAAALELLKPSPDEVANLMMKAYQAGPKLSVWKFICRWQLWFLGVLTFAQVALLFSCAKRAGILTGETMLAEGALVGVVVMTMLIAAEGLKTLRHSRLSAWFVIGVLVCLFGCSVAPFYQLTPKFGTAGYVYNAQGECVRVIDTHEYTFRIPKTGERIEWRPMFEKELPQNYRYDEVMSEQHHVSFTTKEGITGQLIVDYTLYLQPKKCRLQPSVSPVQSRKDLVRRISDLVMSAPDAGKMSNEGRKKLKAEIAAEIERSVYSGDPTVNLYTR